MNDNLSASFVLMAGAGLLAYWFFHLTGAQRKAFLAHLRNTEAMGDLAPYVPQQVQPIGPGSSSGKPDFGPPGAGLYGPKNPAPGVFNP